MLACRGNRVCHIEFRHLLLLQDIWEFTNRAARSVMLHLGTLLSVVIFFLRPSRPASPIILYYLIATIPAHISHIKTVEAVRETLLLTFSPRWLLAPDYFKKNMGTPAKRSTQRKARRSGS